jgi:hypothetical protein
VQAGGSQSSANRPYGRETPREHAAAQVASSSRAEQVHNIEKNPGLYMNNQRAYIHICMHMCICMYICMYMYAYMYVTMYTYSPPFRLAVACRSYTFATVSARFRSPIVHIRHRFGMRSLADRTYSLPFRLAFARRSYISATVSARFARRSRISVTVSDRFVRRSYISITAVSLDAA